MNTDTISLCSVIVFCSSLVPLWSRGEGHCGVHLQLSLSIILCFKTVVFQRVNVLRMISSVRKKTKNSWLLPFFVTPPSLWTLTAYSEGRWVLATPFLNCCQSLVQAQHCRELPRYLLLRKPWKSLSDAYQQLILMAGDENRRELPRTDRIKSIWSGIHFFFWLGNVKNYRSKAEHFQLLLYKKAFSILLLLNFWDRVPCGPGWPQTCFIVEDVLDFWRSYFSLSQCRGYRYTAPRLVLWHQTYGFVHSRQAFYQLSTIARPLYYFKG